jgi:hypothetical protein
MTYFPQVVFSAYAYMFAIAFALSYNILKDLKTATFIAMSVVLLRVIYNYRRDEDVPETKTQDTIVFVTGVTAIFIASHMFKKYKGSKVIDFALYGMILYSVSSFIEWFLHRYVMHCYQKAPWILNFADNNILKLSCVTHKNHHLSVNDDMSLKDMSIDRGLVFIPLDIVELAVLTFAFMVPINYALGIRVSIPVNALFCILAGSAFVIIWNSIHTRMHQKNIDVPFVPKISIPDAIYDGWLNNHDLHHQIKGDDKGNYNVIFLGADEIMGTNNKSMPE